VLALSECFDDEGEGEEAEEAKRRGHRAFRAGEDATVAFHAEEPFDLIAFPIKGVVEAPEIDAVDLGGTTGTMPNVSASCLVSLSS
jgi:hypothetical protein